MFQQRKMIYSRYEQVVFFLLIAILTCFFTNVQSLLPPCSIPKPLRQQQQQQQQFKNVFRTFESSTNDDDINNNDIAEDSQIEATTTTTTTTPIMDVDSAILNRYACTRFQPSNGNASNNTSTMILKGAYESLELARRAPSGFNAQPYKLLLVYDQAQKDAMSKYCCGHNAHRVRESVCTVLFLADRQVLRNWKDYQALSSSSSSSPKKINNTSSSSSSSSKKKKKNTANLKTLGLISLFSSGFPYLPQWVSGPISFCMGFAMRVVSWIFRSKLPVPTLTSSLTWSTKNTMLVAMSYMLACTARGIATCPMEGYTVWGVRKALKIPRRYSIPLIVATGIPFHKTNNDQKINITSTTTTTTKDGEDEDTAVGQDDVGMSHGPPSMASSTPRFSSDEMIYGNFFGAAFGQ